MSNCLEKSSILLRLKIYESSININEAALWLPAAFCHHRHRLQQNQLTIKWKRYMSALPINSRQSVTKLLSAFDHQKQNTFFQKLQFLVISYTHSISSLCQYCTSRLLWNSRWKISARVSFFLLIWNMPHSFLSSCKLILRLSVIWSLADFIHPTCSNMWKTWRLQSITWKP